MRFRQFGKTGYKISTIGFGAWASGGGDWAFSLGAQDDDESRAAILKALDLGINWVDTAPLYGLGHSEEVIGGMLSGMAERPLVFTKCGMPWDDNGRITHSLRRESIRKECEDSLRRLKTEQIDLLQLHWNKPSDEVEEGVDALMELREEGKAREVGVSNFSLDELDMAVERIAATSLQSPYSLIDRTIESEILPYCVRRNIGVLAYSPMASGLLTGKMTRERIVGLAKDDMRRNKSEFQEPQLSRHLETVRVLQGIGGRHNVSAGQAAVAWVLGNPAVTGTIVGLRSASQVEDAVEAVDVMLTDEERDSLSSPHSFAPKKPKSRCPKRTSADF